MLKNDRLRGLVSGICLPIVVFTLLYSGYSFLESSGLLAESMLSKDFRIRTLSIVSIASNAYLINLFTKRRKHESTRFVIFPTFLFIAIWLFIFLKQLL